MSKYWNYILGFNPKNPKHYLFNTKNKVKQKNKQGSLAHTKHFHQNKEQIIPTIKTTIGKFEVVYGEHALKVRFPMYLRRSTTDIDIFSPTPFKDAKEAEKKLDTFFGGDFFYVKKAQHPGTYKVVAYANQEGYADFTKKPLGVPYNEINGIKYITLKEEKKHRMASLRNNMFKFRHGKDQDALNRIKLFEKNKKYVKI